jgi:uncharacterized protein YaaN involved in tellurite resistance
MNEVFLETVEKNLAEKSQAQKWSKKTTSFVEGFAYINTELLIEDQMDKLLGVGINSLTDSAELIKTLTSENIDIIENKLKTLLSDINIVVEKFDLLEKTLNQKKGIFSSKEPIDIFFELFAKEEASLHNIIKELRIKQSSLSDVKESLEEGINQIFNVYTLLERDVKFLSEVAEKFPMHPKDLVRKIYKSKEFELIQTKTDLLTQQQILFQKYGAIRILLDNVANCYKNISFISKVSYSVIMNTVELQKIIQLRQSNLSEKDKEGLIALKNSITVASTDIKLIAAEPFSKHID